MPDTGGYWPSTQQQHLLIAAFGDRDTSAAALQRWWAAVDLDVLDPASFRLLPQLYSNLVAHDLDLPSDRLRGIHRQSWYRNQLQFRLLAEAVNHLEQVAIATLALKGAALAPAYFANLGARPMSDLDVAVPFGDALQAGALLADLGWVPERPLDERALRYSHAMVFRRDGGWELDLHWRVFAAVANDAADATLWSGARGVAIPGAQTRALDPADQILVDVVHGLEWNTVSSIRWVGDVLAVLRHGAPDWDRVVHQAHSLGVVLPMGLGLGYLRDELGADIPDGVVAELRRTRVPAWQRMEMAAKRQPWSSWWAPATMHVIRLLRSRRGHGAARALKAVPGFAAWRLRVDRVTDIPAALWRWVRRLRSRRADAASAGPFSSGRVA